MWSIQSGQSGSSNDNMQYISVLLHVPATSQVEQLLCGSEALVGPPVCLGAAIGSQDAPASLLLEAYNEALVHQVKFVNPSLDVPRGPHPNPSPKRFPKQSSPSRTDSKGSVCLTALTQKRVNDMQDEHIMC